jgi:regulator of cell morphogenesis and NO signaling
MPHTLFSENMRLAYLIQTNYRLLYVLPCFDVGLGIGESTVEQVCRRKGLSTELFLLVCNVYTFDGYIPDTDALTQVPLDDLMNYLHNSHKEYLEKRMPKIVGQIAGLVDNSHVSHGQMLIGFCEKYRQEVVAHFNYEEQTVFPYIRALLDGKRPERYKIREYERNHSDLDAALSDLKNIIIRYLPDECTIERCRDALIDLFLFEADLAKHTLLEERILVSLVERIERGLR